MSFVQEIRNLPAMVKASCRELKRVSSLTGAAMLAALNVLLNQFFTIYVSLTTQIGFTFLAVGLSGMLYGPMVTGMVGVAADILKYLMKPNGGFFPGFTLSEFLMGFIYGAILYKKKITLARAFAAQFCSTVIINLFLTPLWLSMMYGSGFWVLVAGRLLKNLIELPIYTVLLYIVAKKVSELPIARRLA